MLDEFFRTGVYRPRGTAETHTTSSPSMDISKASNFERFVFDLVGRDGGKVRELWASVDAGSGFDLSNTPYFARLAEFGFVSGSNNHAGRLATIRPRLGKVRHDDRHAHGGWPQGGARAAPGRGDDAGTETALPVKFEETIREALNRAPERAGQAGRHRKPAAACRGDGARCRGDQALCRREGGG